MTDVAKIAAGLTKAQREALLWLPADGSPREHVKGSEVSFYCMKEMMRGDPERQVATVVSLCKSVGHSPPTKQRLWGNPIWQATLLGQQVRHHLERNPE